MDVKDEFELKVEEFCLSIKTNDEDEGHKLCNLEKLEIKPNVLVSLLKYDDNYKLDLKYHDNIKHKNCKEEKASLLPETSGNVLTGLDVNVDNKKVKRANFTKQKNKTKTKKVSNQKILNENKIKMHSKYLCAHCNHSTSRRNNFIKHISTHGFKGTNAQGETYKCSCCNKEFASREYLVYHLTKLITTNNSHTFICSRCNAHYGSRYALNMHMMLHTGDLPFKCTYCDFATKRRYILRNHLQNHDRYSLETISKKRLEAARGVNRLKNKLSEGEKEKIKRPSDFNQMDMKRCKCDTCGYMTSKRSSLMYHIVRVHTKEPIFKCSTCDFSTSKSEYLKQHRQSLKHDIFSCEHCSFTCFKFKYLMIQKHMKNHF